METKKIKILLVDDDEMIRILFRDIFWLHADADKYEVRSVDRVRKAEELLKDPLTRPDIIFLDLSLPYDNDESAKTTTDKSFYLLEKIKTDPELRTIKVFIFSGYDDPAYQARASELKADAYLVKSRNLPKDIIATVENSIANGK